MTAEPVAQAWTPACMDAGELALWEEMNGRTSAGHARLPCDDCLPEFSAEMHAEISPEYPQGRCNGTPRGGQEVDAMDDPTTAGVRIPGEVRTGTAQAITPGGLRTPRRVELEVAAPPCGSCAHEPVCALRSAFEGMATVETSAPPLPAGLRLALVATVECSHFLRDRAKPAPVRVLTSQERGAAAHAAGVQAAKPSTADWTPERRAAQGERMRARAEAGRATREGAAAG